MMTYTIFVATDSQLIQGQQASQENRHKKVKYQDQQEIAKRKPGITIHRYNKVSIVYKKHADGYTKASKKSL